MTAVRFFEAALLLLAALLTAALTVSWTGGPLAVTRIADLEVTNQIQMTSSSGPTITAGTGDPNGSITAPIGSIRLQTDTGALWQNTDGSTAWSSL